MAPGSLSTTRQDVLTRKAGDGCDDGNLNFSNITEKAIAILKELQLTFDRVDIDIRKRIFCNFPQDIRQFLIDWISIDEKKNTTNLTETPHKLDYLAEISNLKLKLEASETEKLKLIEKCQSIESANNHLRTTLSIRLQELAQNKQLLMNQSNPSSPDISQINRNKKNEKSLEVLKRKHSEVERLKKCVDQILESKSDYGGFVSYRQNSVSPSNSGNLSKSSSFRDYDNIDDSLSLKEKDFNTMSLSRKASEGSEFQRGTIMRATAGPRLGVLRNGGGSPVVDDVPFDRWDTDRLAAWLQSLGLSQYVAPCKKHSRNGAWLQRASHHDLEKDFGMKNALHRKKLLLAAKSASEPAGDKNEYRNLSRFDQHCVSRWLDDIGLPQYKEIFAESKIDGRVLNQLTVDDLLSLKITSVLHHASIRRSIEMLRKENFDTNCMIRRPLNDNVGGGGGGDEDKDEKKKNRSENVVYWSNHRVMDWLRSIDLAEYTANLRGSGVHGALIVYEGRFTGEQLASILSIAEQKTLLRRHLNMHFLQLVGPQIQAEKRLLENEPGYVPLTLTQKVKPTNNNKTSTKLVTFFSQKRAYKNATDVDDLVCPFQKKTGSQTTNGDLSISDV